jgi:hypothetical protein
VGDYSTAVQDAAAAALRQNARQYFSASRNYINFLCEFVSCFCTLAKPSRFRNFVIPGLVRRLRVIWCT